MKFFLSLFFLLASIGIASLFFWKPHLSAPTASVSKPAKLENISKIREPEQRSPSVISAPVDTEQSVELPDSTEKTLVPTMPPGVETIQAELDALPLTPEYDAARTVLLNAASSLPMDDQDTVDQVHDMALQELFDSSEASQEGEQISSGRLTSFTTFLPVVAHELLLRTAYDEQEAMIITVEGMAYQQDSGVRQSLLKQFIRYYPESAETIHEVLVQRDLVQQSSSVSSALQ